MKLHFPGRATKALRIMALLILCLVGLYSLYIAFSHVFIGDQEVFLFTPTFTTPASPFPLRVAVRNHSDNLPVENATVIAYFLGPKKKRYSIFRGKTDIHGLATATLTTPGDFREAEIELHLTVRSSRGSDAVVKNITLKYPTKIILSSDKSMYRSGETVHTLVKAMSQQKSSRPAPLPVKISIDDSRGTTIFSHEGTASAYGIFSASCGLADPVNVGMYKIRAETPDTYLEKNILVVKNERPVFTVKIGTEKDYLIPGDEVRGTVSALIPPGEPVRKAAVTLRFSLFTDLTTQTLGLVTGETGNSGTYAFRFPVPVHLPPSMAWGENPRALIDVSVIDSGSHKESLARELRLCEKPLAISWIPEGRGFVPGLINRSYIIATYPDKKAASLDLIARTKDRTISLVTDNWGMAELPFDPQKDGTTLRITAKDPHSSPEETVFELSSPISPASFALKTDKVVYRQGERLSVTLDSHDRQTFVFLDLLVNGQIPLSSIAKVQEGKAREEITLPDGITGPAQLLATRISSDGDFEQEWQNLFIIPRKTLQIKIMPGKRAYAPEEIGTINFQCRESNVQSGKYALSVSVKEAREQQGINGAPEKGKESPFGSYITRSSIEIPPSLIDSVISRVEYSIAGIDDGSFQKLARIAFSPLILPRQDIYAKNLYTQNLKNNQERRSRYFSSLFIWLFRGLLIFIIGCFLVILALTLTHAYLKGKDERRVLLLRNNDDVMSLLIFIIGFLLLLLGPMIFFLPIFLFAPLGVKDIQGHPFFPLFLALELFLMFIYLVALWRNVRVRPIRKMLTLKSTFITLQLYVGALIVFISLLFTNSLARWNMEQVLEANIPYMLLALLTLCSMPFLLVYSTLSHVMMPRKSAFHTFTFYLSSAVIICALIVSSLFIFNLSSHLEKNDAAIPEQNKSAGPLQPTGDSSKALKDRPAALPDQATILSIPETLLYVPQLVTDEKGDARLLVQMTDLRSRFTIEALGYEADGTQGRSLSQILVRSDLQLKADFPDILTAGDVISLPVNMTNNSAGALSLKLHMTSPVEKNGNVRAVTLGASENRSVYLPFRARVPGIQKLAIFAKSSHSSATACREIEILPEGNIALLSRGGWLKEAVSLAIAPAGTPSPPYRAELHIYPSLPSLLSELSGALESLPGAHINDVLALSYPDVLLLDYYRKASLKEGETLNKAADRVDLGYQRLLRFESPRGGFSSFIDGNSDLLMTASALQGFADMAEVIPLDTRILDRTSLWLQKQQKQDGSWDNSPHSTASVLLALINGGRADSSKIEKGLEYLRRNIRKDADSETLGLLALALIKSNKDASQLIERLQKNIFMSGTNAYWSSGIHSPSGISSDDGDIRTTAICARALHASGQSADLEEKALNYLMESRDPWGTWYAPSTTYEALKALVIPEKFSPKGGKGSVKVSLGSMPVQSLSIDPEKDLKAYTIDLSPRPSPVAEEVRLNVEGSLQCPYTLSTWSKKQPKAKKKESEGKRLSLKLSFEKKALRINEKLKQMISITNGSDRDSGLAVVQIPVPPGFAPITRDIDDLRIIDAYKIKGDTIYLYLGRVKKGATLTFGINLQARFPARITAPGACIYEYYNRRDRSYTSGAHLTVLP
jgi:hypothetical protein